MESQPDPMKNLTYPSFTLEEYLLREEQSEYRNEYRDGEIEAMAGESKNHSILCFNTMVLLGNHLWDRDCYVFTSNMKVYIPQKNKMYYPDISVTCGEVESALGRNDMIANPLLLFEVLSKRTAKFDQGEKFEDYKTLESLREYVLIDQYQYRVQVFYQDKEGWQVSEYIDPDEFVNLQSINMRLPLRSLYQKVKF